MKSSTKTKIAGISFFIVGSIIVQQFINPILYIGIIFMGLSWMLMTAQLDLERSEASHAELTKLGADIDKSIAEMRELAEGRKVDKKAEDFDCFDSKKSETNNTEKL